MIVTRFAPSPNGSLHLGHAFSAIVAHDLANARPGGRGGRFLLRIEDIDGTRSRAALADEFRADLAWLGLAWHEVAPQSSRVASYEAAAQRLRAMGLLYPCRCTRAEIAAAAQAKGPDGPVYPGTCRGAAVDPAGEVAWRLDVTAALRRTGPLTWTDELAGVQAARPDLAGDVVLVRKDRDTPASYHLAATLDDAADGVTLVTRGMDLFAASHVHRLLAGAARPAGADLAPPPVAARYRTAASWPNGAVRRRWPTGARPGRMGGRWPTRCAPGAYPLALASRPA